MNHIELFAGCGGLSLGLDLAGFELTLANELSPMAGETFAYNFLNENLAELANDGKKHSDTYWLSSAYTDLTQRLRENPFHYPELGAGESDMPSNPKDMKGKLVIGNIVQLNQYLEENPKFTRALKGGFGEKGVDLVSGGPPCQSFSMAGLRKKDCDKNSLPWEFANFVEHVQPKIAVLENVTGILRAFTEDGVSYHAWFEVAKVFASKGYIPLCLHINARLAGIPQNRPRFIMLAVQEKTYKKISKKFNYEEEALFKPGWELHKAINSGLEPSVDTYRYFDAKSDRDTELFKNSFLKELVDQGEVSVKSALDDLRFNKPARKSNFVKSLNGMFDDLLPETVKLQNHEARRNSPLVQRRFRIYQVIQKLGRGIIKEVFSVLKQEAHTLSESAWTLLKDHEYLLESGEHARFSKKEEFVDYLSRHPTKKQTQKALDASSPAPAALSIPDDACHYHDHELRTLTVREMARIQSFPDRFVFRSKVTTGGQMRKFEVPQYTQVGNAVPPLLGYRLGLAIKELLSK